MLYFELNTTIMKKTIFILILLQLLLSCSKDNNAPTKLEDYFSTGFFGFDFSIEHKFIEGFNLEGVQNGLDTNQVFLYGRLNEKLWIRCYKKPIKNKTISISFDKKVSNRPEPIFEWVDDEKLDTTLFFGEKVKNTILIDPYYSSNQFYFILMKIGSKTSRHDLYFINNNNLILKRKSYYNSTYKFQSITPWHNGIMVNVEINQPLSSIIEHICFSAKGDSLYSHNGSVSLEYSTPINIEECIVNGNDNTHQGQSFSFKRYNLKNKEIIWENKIESIKNISTEVILDSTALEKENKIWRYAFYYNSIDGAKFTKTINVNIVSGELSIEE